MEKKRKSCSSGTTFSCILIIVGVLLLSKRLGWISYELSDILLSWQMLLIVLGIYSLTKRHWLGGSALLTVGASYLAPHLNLPWLPVYTPELIWPVLLIIAGIAFLCKSVCGKTTSRKSWEAHTKNEYTTTDGFVRSENLFGSIRQVVLDEIFKGAVIHNRFGGTIIDLRRTEIEVGETYIDIDCSFGGVEIFLPSHWKVETICQVMMGGCEDKRIPHPNIDQTRSLIIRGNITLGGVEIKS